MKVTPWHYKGVSSKCCVVTASTSSKIRRTYCSYWMSNSGNWLRIWWWWTWWLKKAEIFSCRSQEGAALTKWAYGMMGFPSIRNSNNMVHCTLISHCTILPGDISTTNKIYSPNVHSIKGETVWRQPTPVVTGSIVIPPEVLNKHRDVTMAADVMQVKIWHLCWSCPKESGFWQQSMLTIYISWR